MLRLRKAILILLLTGISVSGHAQVKKPQNKPTYDYKWLHFGFSIGLNTMDFSFRRPLPATANDSLFADVSTISPGFNVSIVSELRINDDWSFRFLPGITFGQRKVSFYKQGGTDGSGILDRAMVIESNYIDFPMLFKYKSKRLNNFRPYLVGGLNVRYDMAARKEYEEDAQVYMRLKKMDLCYEIGVGLDYFLQYFKFSTELKLSVGLRNMIVDEPADDFPQYVNSIDGLNSYVVMLIFHFE